jgi:hypothetical protein
MTGVVRVGARPAKLYDLDQLGRTLNGGKIGGLPAAHLGHPG